MCTRPTTSYKHLEPNGVMRQVLGHSVQGQKSPLHNSISLKTSSGTQYSDSKTGLIKISQRFLWEYRMPGSAPSSWENLEFVFHTRCMSHQVNLLNVDMRGTLHIKSYSSNAV